MYYCIYIACMKFLCACSSIFLIYWNLSLSSAIRCPYIEMRTCIFVLLYHFHSRTQKEITCVTYVLSVKFSTHSFTYDVNVLVICTYLILFMRYANVQFFPKPLSTGNSPNESKLRELPPWQSYKFHALAPSTPGCFERTQLGLFVVLVMDKLTRQHKILTKCLIKTAKSCRISKISKISMWISMWIHVEFWALPILDFFQHALPTCHDPIWSIQVKKRADSYPLSFLLIPLLEHSQVSYAAGATQQ